MARSESSSYQIIKVLEGLLEEDQIKTINDRKQASVSFNYLLSLISIRLQLALIGAKLYFAASESFLNNSLVSRLIILMVTVQQ